MIILFELPSQGLPEFIGESIRFVIKDAHETHKKHAPCHRRHPHI